jgi:dipeptidyl aminopeptidase/acylaminoacyl peptidase
MNHWTHGNVRPLDSLGAGAVAIIIPVPGGPTEVRVLDPLTSRSCLLLELPGGSAVADAQWSPSGDALAIDKDQCFSLHSAAEDCGVYVWSAMGTTRAMLPDGGPLAWSPDGSRLAVGSTTGMWVLPGDGATPIQLHCDPPGRNVECPAGPQLLWSPNGDRLVMTIGDRMDSNLYGPASVLDPVFHQVAVAPALGGLYPIGWLDSQTLIEASDSQLFEVPVDDKTQYRAHDLPLNWSAEPIISPDQRLRAFGSFGKPVRILDVATGQEKVVIGPTQLGTDVDYGLAWASDNRSLVASAEQRSADNQGVGFSTPLGLWVVNADGSGLHKLMSGQVWPVGTPDSQANQAALRSSWATALDGPAGSPPTP